jgi:ketosteroid isomerase-like protein
MTADEDQLRDLIDRWAEAVHGGDLEGVLADHSEDIVMFDVPRPKRAFAWPPFFEWQRSGASFEIVSLDVAAGEDVAFAWALLRCGTPEDDGNGRTARLLELEILMSGRPTRLTSAEQPLQPHAL